MQLRASVDLMVDLDFFFNQLKLSLATSILKKTTILQDGRYEPYP